MAVREISDEQLDVLVEQRLSERKKVVEEVVAALDPRLEGIRKEAHSANGLKRTLGRQLNRVERAVAKLGQDVTDDRAELERHAELFEEFGVENLSLEQKQALPGVLEDRVQEKKNREVLERRADRRMAAWLVIGTFLGSVAGAVVAVVAVLALQASAAYHFPGVP